MSEMEAVEKQAKPNGISKEHKKDEEAEYPPMTLIPRKSLSLDVKAGRDNIAIGYLDTLIHIFKGNVGPGLFAMGDAYMNGGLALAPVLIVTMAVISVHCQHILVNCAEKMRILRGEEVCDGYAETVEHVFENGPTKLKSWAPGMKIVVNVFICVTQLGFCCIYFVFITTNVKQILNAHDVDIDIHLVMLMAFVPVLLTSLITNLKLLTPVSLFANILMISGLVITLYYVYKDTEGLDSLDERNFFTTPGQMALAFGTVMFAFEGIALVLPLKNEMREPHNFERPLGVLNVGMSLVTFLFTFAGLSGYLKWGEEVQGSLTLNLGDTILAQCVKAMVGLGVLLGYPLQFFIAIQIMWPNVKAMFKWEGRALCGELAFRTIMVLVTLAIAQLVPALSLFISLIGALCSTALALVFPSMIELVTKSEDDKGPGAWITTKDVFIIVLAFTGFVTGTYQSLLQITEHFGQQQEL